MTNLLDLLVCLLARSRRQRRRDTGKDRAPRRTWDAMLLHSLPTSAMTCSILAREGWRCVYLRGLRRIVCAVVD
jgi:hypothetical protein